METHRLQNIILIPEILGSDEALFQRWVFPPTPRLRADSGLRLKGGERLDLMTFYNAFSIFKWRNLTEIEDFGVLFDGAGTLLLTIVAYGNAGKVTRLGSRKIDLSEKKIVWFGDSVGDETRIVAVEIEALDDDVLLIGGRWVTSKEPVRNVNIAAVITTFNREVEALNAANKFSKIVVPEKNSGVGKLFLIDNGNTLNLEPMDGVEVLANRNLGGAGGFTRGLIEARNSGDFTHVLFMDDDANVHPESVWRTAALLRYAVNDEISISGAMLYENNPTLQHEKSAIFRVSGRSSGSMKSLGNRLDLVSKDNLVRNEDLPRGNYGAWFYFCFPIGLVAHLPFPFFVRGDDIEFSIANDLIIETLNGISTFSTDFSEKAGPATDYLTARSTLATAFIHGDTRRQASAIEFWKRRALRFGGCFDYARMEALTKAMEVIGKGPSYFGRNPSAIADMAELRAADSAVATAQELTFKNAMRATGFDLSMNKLLRWGHRVPKRYTKNRVVHSDLRDGLQRANTLRAQYTGFGEGANCRIMRKDVVRYRTLRKRLEKIASELERDMDDLAATFRAEHAKYRSEEFWRDALGLDDAPSIQPAGATEPKDGQRVE